MTCILSVPPPMIDVEWEERSGNPRYVSIVRGKDVLLKLDANDARALGAALIEAAGRPALTKPPQDS